MNSQSAGKQPPTHRPPARHDPSQSTRASIYDKIEAAESSMLAILKAMPYFILLDFALTRC